jgi:hypothetical protein
MAAKEKEEQDIENIIEQNDYVTYPCEACKIKHIDQSKHSSVVMPCDHKVCMESFQERLKRGWCMTCPACDKKLKKEYVVIQNKQVLYLPWFAVWTLNIFFTLCNFIGFVISPILPITILALESFAFLTFLGVYVGRIGEQPYLFDFLYVKGLSLQNLVQWFHEAASIEGSIIPIAWEAPMLMVMVIVGCLVFCFMSYMVLNALKYKAKTYFAWRMRKYAGIYYSV